MVTDAAWGRIEAAIRQELAETTRETYQKHLRQYLDQLRAASQMTLNPPS